MTIGTLAVGIRRGIRRAISGIVAGLRWLRPPRRLLPTSFGVVFLVGTFLVGIAAVNTGNNLLYLLLGAMLGFIAVSGWLSERMLRGLRIRRELPRGVTAGPDVRITYRIGNEKSRLPSFAVDIGEARLPDAGKPGDGDGVRRGFLPRLDPGCTDRIRSRIPLRRRGVYHLEGVTLSTAFPFGLFRKERDVRLEDELVVWPRTDRAVREVHLAGGGRRRRETRARGDIALRGEYRTLRAYRPGDDPRDVHWASTARTGELVVREYERDDARSLWICLDRRAAPGEVPEAAVEKAAALAARAHRRSECFGFATQGRVVRDARGSGQLERVLEALARVEFDEEAAPLVPPVAYEECVLVAPGPVEGSRFGDTLLAADDDR